MLQKNVFLFNLYPPMRDGPVKVLKSDLNERKIKNVRI